jgi:outer membrane lipoprotein-sorting protein
MGELGDLLELLHDARNRYRTVRATIREWRHEERQRRAWEQYVASMPRDRSRIGVAVSTGLASAPVPPPESETILRVWLEWSDRIREEREPVTGLEESTIGVRDRDRWWHYSPSQGALSNEADVSIGSGIGQTVEQLLDPAHLISSFDFELLGTTEHTGRQAFRAIATPRQELPPWFGAHREPSHPHDLIVDRERGLLLRDAALIDGEEYWLAEVLEIAFDESFPPDTFVFIPPAGETVQPALGWSACAKSSREQALHTVSIEEAARLAPFRVWIPSRIPSGWRLMHVTHTEGQERPGAGPAVNLHYLPDDGTHQLSVHETVAGDSPWAAWEEPKLIEHGGEEFRVIELEPDQPWRQTMVFCERGGTLIQLASDLELETLLQLAASLAPAPTEPPRLD